MSHGVGFAGSAATARRLAVPFLGMTANCRAVGRADVWVVHLLIREGVAGRKHRVERFVSPP